MEGGGGRRRGGEVFVVGVEGRLERVEKEVEEGWIKYSWQGGGIEVREG